MPYLMLSDTILLFLILFHPVLFNPISLPFIPVFGIQPYLFCPVPSRCVSVVPLFPVVSLFVNLSQLFLAVFGQTNNFESEKDHR